MKKALVVFVILIIFAFVIGEIYGYRTGILEKKIDTYSTELSNLEKENRNLRINYLMETDPSRIDSIARNKLKMAPPDSYFIVDMEHGR